MPRDTLLHKVVLELFKPKLVEEEGRLDDIFLGLFGMFLSTLFIGIFGSISTATALQLKLGMFISYATLFIYIIFTLYHSLPLLDYVDEQIKNKNISHFIRAFSGVLLATIILFVWLVVSSFMSISQTSRALISQGEYLYIGISLLALLCVIIPNYLSNFLFEKFNFILEVEKE